MTAERPSVTPPAVAPDGPHPVSNNSFPATRWCCLCAGATLAGWVILQSLLVGVEELRIRACLDRMHQIEQAMTRFESAHAGRRPANLIELQTDPAGSSVRWVCPSAPGRMALARSTYLLPATPMGRSSFPAAQAATALVFCNTLQKVDTAWEQPVLFLTRSGAAFRVPVRSFQLSDTRSTPTELEKKCGQYRAR